LKLQTIKTNKNPKSANSQKAKLFEKADWTIRNAYHRMLSHNTTCTLDEGLLQRRSQWILLPKWWDQCASKSWQ